MRKIQKRSDCPISYSLDILGDKWTLLILRDIALNNKHYYKEFLQAGEGIATNVLSDRLKMLVEYGVIAIRKHETNKVLKVYYLTPKGKQLIPLLIELWKWGAKHDPESAVSPEALAEKEKNEGKLLQEYFDAAEAAEKIEE